MTSAQSLEALHAPPQAIVQPGRDAAGHAQALKVSLANSLTDLYGVKMEPFNLTPPQQQPVVEGGEKQGIQRAAAELDLEGLWAGLRGETRTDQSGHFLSTLMGKIRKQHPDKDLKLE